MALKKEVRTRPAIRPIWTFPIWQFRNSPRLPWTRVRSAKILLTFPLRLSYFLTAKTTPHFSPLLPHLLSLRSLRTQYLSPSLLHTRPFPDRIKYENRVRFCTFIRKWPASTQKVHLPQVLEHSKKPQKDRASSILPSWPLSQQYLQGLPPLPYLRHSLRFQYLQLPKDLQLRLRTFKFRTK